MKALLSTGTVRILAALLVLAVGMILGPQAAQALTVGPSVDFANPLNYDNTANTVSGNPNTTHNNQTFGLMRDVFWWRINNGAPAVGSPDFINAGNSLILQANHAVPGGGPFKALNFTGPSVSGGQSYLAVYDTSVGNVAPTSTFSATGGLQIFADFLFVKHNVSAGLVALYGDGQSGLALLANNVDGNNQDHTKVSLIFQNAGQGTVLESQNLASSSFCTATDGGVGCSGTLQNPIDHWYRVVMDLTEAGGLVNVTGTFFNHLITSDPTSPLAALPFNTITENGISLGGNSLSNPGEIGLIAMGNESISLPDNVGVSVYCFNGCGTVPEPASLLLLGSGLVGLAAWQRRRRNA